MFEKLSNANRILMEARLAPVQGHRFQPTGFPDLGAATYQLPDGTRMLLLESAQSMANRLENTIIGADNEIIEDFQGLPYIRAQLSGGSETNTNSLIEAHRINSPFIITDQSFQKKFKEKAHYEAKKPLNWQKIAEALFHFDVNSLIHGTFLANLEDGRVKVPRSVSAFIEARNIKEVVSGGVKNNSIDPTGTLRAKGFEKDVYGNVPYQRVEYTADEIIAYFNVDVGLLRSYALGENAFRLMVALILFKIRKFLDSGARLRTACDLKRIDALKVTEPEGFSVLPTDTLLETVKKQIAACKPMFADPPVTEIATETVVKKKGDTEQAEELVVEDEE